MIDDDVPALLSRGAFYISDGDGGWTEAGWTEGPVTLLSSLPAGVFEPAFAPGPRTMTATFSLDRAHARRLRHWILSLGNPGPLCIDGREYSRRRAARRRRG